MLFIFQLKCGIMEQVEAVMAMQRPGKHVSATIDTDTTEAAVFFMYLVPRLRNKD
jgi:hypothetical protein